LLVVTTSKEQITFKIFADIDDVFTLLQSLINSKENGTESMESDDKSEPEFQDDGLGNAEEDWELILNNGTFTAKYSKDEYVIKEGRLTKRIYQIVKGSCRIEKRRDDDTTTQLAKIQPTGETVDSIFGEISFLGGGDKAASASVIADEDTTIYIIEPYFLNILFQYNPSLSGRFFYFLSKVLSKRLMKRQSVELNLARSVELSKVKRKRSAKKKFSISIKGNSKENEPGKEGL